ncbi:MAG: hypothetical protein NTW86_01030 [Candidatus Sumerlaeota bacterium]|nr:hypothetical protein [Candidatus Sumerlaeota bacterium]
MFRCIALVFAVLAVCLTAWANQPETEPNGDRFSASGPINFNETLIGGLPESYGAEGGFPQDYWSFSAVAGRGYQFVATPKNTLPSQPLDIGLEIWDASGGAPVASKDAAGGNQAETLIWTCPVGGSGTYYLCIYEATGTPNGIAHYEIAATETPAAGVDDWVEY